MTRDDMTDLRKAAEDVLEHCTEVVSGWQTLAPLSVTEAAVASLNNLRAALDKHKKRMAREKKRVKPRVPPWMMRP